MPGCCYAELSLACWFQQAEGWGADDIWLLVLHCPGYTFWLAATEDGALYTCDSQDDGYAGVAMRICVSCANLFSQPAHLVLELVNSEPTGLLCSTADWPDAVDRQGSTTGYNLMCAAQLVRAFKMWLSEWQDMDPSIRNLVGIYLRSSPFRPQCDSCCVALQALCQRSASPIMLVNWAGLVSLHASLSYAVCQKQAGIANHAQRMDRCGQACG
jgi:hypothetical protein